MKLPLAEAFQSLGNAVPDFERFFASFTAYRDRIGSLPPAFTTFFLELRMGADDAQVDFLSLSTLENGDQKTLLDFPPFRDQASLTAEWQATLDFCRRWGREGSWENRELPFLWLEFDNPMADPRPVPGPSPAVGLEKDYFRRLKGGAAWKSTTLDKIFRSLEALGAAPGPAAAEALERIHEALGEGGNIIHISHMMTRSPQAIKLYLSLPRPEVSDFLAKARWPGPCRDMVDLISRFNRTHTVFLDLTVTDRFEPRIAVALSQLVLNQYGWNSWYPHIEEWVSPALCDPGKLEALRRWEGFHGVTHGGRDFLLRRYLDFKPVWEPEKPLALKAYLGITPLRLPPSGRPIAAVEELAAGIRR